MSCFHPLELFIYENEKGDRKYNVRKYNADLPQCAGYRYVSSNPLPCGNCIGCRQDQAAMWANRLILESKYHDTAYFITLTYDDEHLPASTYVRPSTGELLDTVQGTLDKRDAQLFIKRLRKYFNDDTIRYYLVGEYGSEAKTYRPHYHMIVFGMHYDESDLIYAGKNKKGYPHYAAPLLERIWSKGKVDLEFANYYTMRYVTSYVTSKVGKYNTQSWLQKGLEPPFSLMSRKPGLGAEWLRDNPEKANVDHIIVSTPEGAIDFPSPRYFKKVAKEKDPELYQRIADRRSKSAKDKIQAQNKRTNLSYLDRLRVEEENFIKRKKEKNNL